MFILSVKTMVEEDAAASSAYPCTRDQMSRLFQLERKHFWFVGRRAFLRSLFKKYISSHEQLVLDLGCGTGHMVEILTRQGYRVLGLDIRLEGLQATRRLIPRSWLVQGQATYLPFADKSFEVVLLVDVLEHTEDVAALREVRRVMKPDGLLILTVPAVPFLWSYRDEIAGHLRRYTHRQLREVMEEARLKVEQVSYYQCLLFPLFLTTRLLGRWSKGSIRLEEQPPALFNTLLIWVSILEVELGRVVNWPWGSTLVSVGRRV